METEIRSAKELAEAANKAKQIFLLIWAMKLERH
jgi:hypothetical protein